MVGIGNTTRVYSFGLFQPFRNTGIGGIIARAVFQKSLFSILSKLPSLTEYQFYRFTGSVRIVGIVGIIVRVAKPQYHACAGEW